MWDDGPCKKLGPFPPAIVDYHIIKVDDKLAILRRVHLNFNGVPVNISGSLQMEALKVVICYGRSTILHRRILIRKDFKFLTQVNLQVIDALHAFLLIFPYHAIELVAQFVHNNGKFSLCLAYQRHQL